MTFPSAESLSSIRWILTSSGNVLRRCCSSWSVVDVGTNSPFLFLYRALSAEWVMGRGFIWIEWRRGNSPSRQPSDNSCPRYRSSANWHHILQLSFEYAIVCPNSQPLLSQVLLLIAAPLPQFRCVAGLALDLQPRRSKATCSSLLSTYKLSLSQSRFVHINRAFTSHKHQGTQKTTTNL